MFTCVYVAGPYTGETPWRVQENVRRAESACFEIWNAGAVAFSPHKNSEHFFGNVSWDQAMVGCLHFLETCDVIFVCTPDYKESLGTRIEVARAEEMNMPVLTDMGELLSLIDERRNDDICRQIHTDYSEDLKRLSKLVRAESEGLRA